MAEHTSLRPYKVSNGKNTVQAEFMTVHVPGLHVQYSLHGSISPLRFLFFLIKKKLWLGGCFSLKGCELE